MVANLSDSNSSDRSKTPSQIYSPQHEFYILHSDKSQERLVDAAAIAVLQEAIIIARRIMLTDLATRQINISFQSSDPPVPAGAILPQALGYSNRGMDQDILTKQENYMTNNSFKIVINKTIEEYACVYPLTPHNIHIKESVVISAATAYVHRFIKYRSYCCTIFYLALIITHELVHSQRLSGVVMLKDTPPSIRAHSEGLRFDAKRDLYYGGNGDWFEKSVYGGEVFALLEQYPTYQDEVSALIMETYEPPYTWFVIDDSVIADIVHGTNRWTSLLPFRAASNQVIHQGCNNESRLKKISLRYIEDQQPASILLTHDHTNKRDERAPMKPSLLRSGRRRGNIKCGYAVSTGDGGQQEKSRGMGRITQSDKENFNPV